MNSMFAAWVLVLLGQSAGEGLQDAPAWRIQNDSGHDRVVVELDGRPLLSSPPEGVWSVAGDWQDGWPADWRHASPEKVTKHGDWTILSGQIRLAHGHWQLRDAYRAEGRLLRCTRRWEWHGAQPAGKTTLSIRFTTPMRQPQAFFPGILYYGNPSGARSGRVPVFTGRPGEQALFEEHRFPMPFAFLEGATPQGLAGVAIHCLPSPAPYGHLRDQWWSIGATVGEDAAELVMMSGPCASNGKRSVIKAVQPGFVPYDEAWLDVSPGAVIEKTFWLEASAVKQAGAGFRRPVRTAIERCNSLDPTGLPTFAEILREKYRYALSRWYERDAVAGFSKFPDRNILVMGWCGQADALGYALQVLGDRLGDPQAASRVTRSLDWLTHAEFYDGGFRTWYHCDTNTWAGDEPLSQGQAMLNFARAIRLGRQNKLQTQQWEAFLRRACDVHAQRILADNWRPPSTAEAFFIAPLCEASTLFQSERYKQAAVKAGQVFADRHLDMREPYWGGTLDASCEDKEGAFAALQGFLALHSLTGDPKYLAWAEHAGDVTLSYVVLWDIDLPAGRLRDHGFRTRGWTVVSPQNQHIDVFGVLIAADVYRLGLATGRDDLKRLAILMYRTCGQIIDPFGSQGEQPQHTNYTQAGEVADIRTLRGGYNEHWTVFWITAHFLNAAAQFQELDVPIW